MLVSVANGKYYPPRCVPGQPTPLPNIKPPSFLLEQKINKDWDGYYKIRENGLSATMIKFFALIS
jgi:hypothetical protein